MAWIADNVFQVLIQFSVILTVTGFFLPTGRKTSFGDLPEEHMNVTQLIRYHGYPCVDHTVITEDGYVLSVQRIPHGRNGIDRKSPRPVVFLQHGLLSSSADWVLNLANESLAFILADAGYDVWLGNMRGNTYSRKHVKHSPNDVEFWNFSWDEMAEFDLPAMLNFALNKTGQSQLYYVGHSQGTTIAFAQLSQDQELAKKVKTFFALAPVITLGHMGGAKILAYFANKFLFKMIGVREFLPSKSVTKLLAEMVCSMSTQDCKDVLFLLEGYDPAQLNQTRLPVYVSHSLEGTSTKNSFHFVQMVKSNKLQAYDYEDTDKNMQHYSQTTAPVYPFEKMTTPVALFSGGNDWLANPTDLSAAIPHLKNVVYNSNISNFNHMDFILGMDAYKQYDEIIKIIRKTEAASFY